MILPSASLFPVTGVILAGGKGTRLVGLFPTLPKPLVPVAGEPFLHWVTVWLKQQGITDFVFSIGHLAQQIESWASQAPVLKEKSWKTCIEEHPLGTGGGVRACLPFCKENLLVTNGDSMIITPLHQVIDRFLSVKEWDAVIVGKKLPDTSRYASLEVDSAGHLIAYREKVPGKGLISAGIYLFRRSLLEPFPHNETLSMEYDIIPALLKNGKRIMVYQAPEEAAFLDIGTPETVAQADAFIENNLKT